MKKVVCVIVFILFLYPYSSSSAFGAGMEVHFIDVGQGDSILVELPSKKTMLIDGGPPEAGKRLVAYLKRHGIQSLDLIVATHPDKDHIGGLIEVMKQLEVKQIIESGKIHMTKTYYRYSKAIGEQEIPVQIAEENKQINLDPLVEIDILNADRKRSNNQSSIALKMTYGEVDFLLLSDIEKKQEEKIMERTDVEADILKVAHHGSKTSTSETFLRAADPQVAIITYSKNNKFGHPVPRVIESLNKTDTLIYSTASFGDLVVATNGEYYVIIPQQSPIDRMVESS